jgi:hypothetical protein
MILNPKITFGMIVLNGEPFIKYNLRSIYPFAHQIIVVEGAALASAGISTEDGHSNDDTLQSLFTFKTSEDKENKLIIVTAEDEGHKNGFWPGEKDEQSRAYAKRANGDYLWQVDVDEFYKHKDMETVIGMLRENPNISAVSFKMITFWGDFNTITDGWYLRRGANQYHRLFCWRPGYQYSTHRPPTVLDQHGNNLREQHWIKAAELSRRGIFLYHYSLVFPKQVLDKCNYYTRADWARSDGAEKWAKRNYLNLQNPFRVHNVYNYPSWLEKFKGKHPVQIECLKRDISDGKINVQLRNREDVDQILRSPLYKLLRQLLILIDYPLRGKTYLLRLLSSWLRPLKFNGR